MKKQMQTWRRLGCLAILNLGLNATMAADVPAPEAEKTHPWDASLSAGLTLSSGNTESTMANVEFKAVKKWDANEVNLGASGSYGESKDPKSGDSIKNNETYRAYGQFNRSLNDRIYASVRAEGLHDGIADVKYRITISPGLGAYLIKEEKGFLRVEIGPGYVMELVEEKDSTTGLYYNNHNDFATLRVAERGEWKITDNAKVWEYVEVLPEVGGWNNTLINAEVGLDVAISAKIWLTFKIQDTYDNEPASGRKKNDVKIITSLTYKF